ncbi:MAG: TonB-dependent receptor [Bacteroidia bacterium]|nr:TonB-dependent receptor [Bacteroidia bacterium]
MSFRTEFGIDLLNQQEETYNGRRTADNTGFPGGVGFYATASILNYTFTNTLTYTKNFNEAHDLEALAGTSFQKSTEDLSSVQGINFPSDDFRKIASAGTINAGSTSGTEFSFFGYFARANYKFKNKYLFLANVRYEASSRFGENNRYGFFPGASAGWVISEESLWRILIPSAS